MRQVATPLAADSVGGLYLFIGAYYALYGGWLMVLGYAVLLIVGIYEIITKDIKRRRLRRNYQPTTYRRRVYQTANRWLNCKLIG